MNRIIGIFLGLFIVTKIGLVIANADYIQDSDQACLRGINLFEKGRDKEAIKEFNSAIKINPKNVSAYFWKGRVLFVGFNDCSGAKLSYEKVNELDKEYAFRFLIYMDLGQCSIREGASKEKAIEYFQKSKRAAPHHGNGDYGLGKIYLGLAKEHLNQVIRVGTPTSPEMAKDAASILKQLNVR